MKIIDEGVTIVVLSRVEATRLAQALVAQLAGTSDYCFEAILRDPENPKHDARTSFVVSDVP